MRRAWQRLLRSPVWLRNRIAPPAVVLHYHRVTRLADDPHYLAIAPERFAEHLEVLRRFGRPVPLRTLAAAVRAGGWIRRAVVVTFDDGYADNLLEARPLLDRYDVPATVFVVAGGVDAEREFWWDELDRLLLGSHALPDEPTLVVADLVHRWRLEPPAGCANAAPALAGDARRRARLRVLEEMHTVLKPHPPAVIDAALDDLRRSVGMPRAVRASHRTLTTDEVRRLADGGLVEIGAHTVSHPRLSALPIAEQRRELRDGKTALEALLGAEVTSVAYPYGRRADYGADTVAAAREAGFACACTTESGVVWGRRTDPFQLPRLAVDGMDGNDLERWLRWFALG